MLQQIVEQFNQLMGQTWFWVVLALVLMFFFTKGREGFSTKGDLDEMKGNYQSEAVTLQGIE